MKTKSIFKHQHVALALLSALIICQSGCTQTEGTLGGAAVGTGAGAGVGYAIGGKGGAALGGVIGGLAGGALGNHMADQENRASQAQSRTNYSAHNHNANYQRPVDYQSRERLELERQRIDLERQQLELERQRIELENQRRMLNN